MEVVKMNNFLIEMQRTSIKAKSSIDNSFHALSYIDSDFKYFLLNFFNEDINKNLFLTQIFYDGPDSMNQFQSIIFEKSCDFFKKLLCIDGLSFHYDANIPLSSIDLILSDTKIASINIFHRQLILYEKVFFESINNGIEYKTNKRNELVDKYNNKAEGLNDFSIFSIEDESNLAKSVMKTTVLKKKTKKERLNELELLNYEILAIEDEISELMITKQMLIKNLNNIKYFQEKIQSRIFSNLHYKTIID